MKGTTFGSCTALAAGALLAGGLVMSPAAYAVEPTEATATYDCGSFGSGAATLTATQDGTAATITLTSSAVTAPIPIAENSVTSSLTLAKNGTDTAVFTGSSNPAMATGDDVSTGPLTGTVAAGDSLDSLLPAADQDSLTITVMGITVTCDATSAQTPGPFVFD